jgi:UDP:flavonoid glycosyltransferase YjiC (YdhE family)
MDVSADSPTMNARGCARKPRILFMAEMVTLAHLARPLALIEAAGADDWECVLASAPSGRRFLGAAELDWRRLDSLDAPTFAHRLSRGQPVYTRAELAAYVQADLALINAVQPDLVIGDFRLSLSVSARLAGVTYATITNTYWSPHALDQAVVLPVLPWSRYLPLVLTQALFDRLHPLFLAAHCRPMNEVRKAYGLPALAADLRTVYTDADHLLCADAPSLFPVRRSATNHWSLGPVLWSPPVPLPAWWHGLPDDRPVVYLTLGSSGDRGLLPGIVGALAELDVCLVVATAGAELPPQRRLNVWAADYLPGAQVSARASLVVCNGGSPTSQQAVNAGVPVLGLCGNMDQFLNMRGLVRAGLGQALRSDRLSAQQLTQAARELLAEPSQAIARHAVQHRGPDLRVQFPAFLRTVLGVAGRQADQKAPTLAPDHEH